MDRKFTEQEKVRRSKLDMLTQKGIKPFGSKYEITSNSREIKRELFR